MKTIKQALSSAILNQSMAILAVSLIFIAFFLSGCKTEGESTALPAQEINVSKQQKKAMEAVVSQMNSAAIQWTNSMNELQKDPIKGAFSHKLGDVIQKYHDDLVAIDISGCPEDFRIAVVKYYQAVMSSKDYADSITGWNGVLKGMAQGVGSLFSLHDNTDKAVDPLVKAGNELELVLTKYNVDVK